MESDHAIRTWLQSQLLEHTQRFDSRQLPHQGIDHDVADQMNLPIVVAFPSQVFDSGGFGHQQHVAERVGHDPVDLFWHGPVETAQTRFHMRHGYAEFGGGQRRCHRRVDVAHHNQPVVATAAGRATFQNLLHLLEYASCLRPVLSRSDFQVNVRALHSQFLEEDIGQLAVVVLPRVNEGGMAI